MGRPGVSRLGAIGCLLLLTACTGPGRAEPAPMSGTPTAVRTTDSPSTTAPFLPPAGPSTARSAPPPATSPTSELPVPSPTTAPPADPAPPASSATVPASPASPAPESTPWPQVDLAGVNDPTCSDNRPPVLLLHGTFSTAASNFGPLSQGLLAAGRCVWAVDYGTLGTAAVRDSAAQVAGFARQVLESTRTDRLDVVGYSQGGLVLRAALRLDDLAPVVRTAVLLAPSFHGTALSGVGDLPVALCPACRDQLAGSALLAELAVNGDLDGTVRYAVLSTVRDDVVIPVDGQVPQGPPDRVRSALVEDLCPTLVTDHVALPATATAVAWTVAVLQDWSVDPIVVPC